jgi:hypothetical protein
MSKQLISKSISFDNFDEYAKAFQAISARPDVKIVNASGSVRTDENGNKFSKFSIGWEENETL